MPQRPSTVRGSTSFSVRCSDAATRSSVRWCATARSCSTSSTRPPSCPPAGPTCRRAAPTGSSAATTTRCSATTPGRTRGRASCSPPSCGCGPRAARPTAASRSTEDDTPPPRYAFIGVRSCDLHAIAVQDRVFMEGGYVDQRLPRPPRGRLHRRGQLRPGRGDLLLRLDGDRPEGDQRLRPRAHRVSATGHFVVEVGSERGAEVLAELEHREAQAAELRPRSRDENAAAGQTRAIETDGIKELLYATARPALGRRGRPLPDLRQLHDGVPHLLLPHGGGRHRPRRRGGGARAHCGTRASRSTLLHPRRQRPRSTKAGTGSG